MKCIKRNRTAATKTVDVNEQDVVESHDEEMLWSWGFISQARLDHGFQEDLETLVGTPPGMPTNAPLVLFYPSGTPFTVSMSPRTLRKALAFHNGDVSIH